MLRIVFAVLACMAVSAQAQQVPGVTAKTIVIGQSTPLTGSNAELGNDIRNGALAYLQKINDAGGIHGRRIELVTLDDGNAVPRAEENTKKLVEEQKVPFLSPFTGADPMRVYNKYVYNMRASYADELEKIVEHFQSLGVKRFSIVYYDDVVGRENL